jgi:hypothetical protein
MAGLRRLAIAVLAAATVAAGSLATTSSASAMPMSCTTRLALGATYIATGNVFYGVGSYQLASYWYGKAEGIMTGC